MANSIPWSSTAKFSRNGVLVAPLRVSYVRSLSEASRRTSIEEQYEAEAGALRIES